jgi:uncharacterized damage-inducible protein DinB
MSSESTLSLVIKKETVRRICDEGIIRLKKCIDLLSEKQLWNSPNEHSNSIGNLILHLNGNVNQWILSTLGDQIDQRQRALEFRKDKVVAKEALISLLDELDNKVRSLIGNLNEEDINKEYEVQCYTEHGVSILIHVIEHFSYHVGQVTFYTKLLLDIDTNYYVGQDLGKKASK